MGLRGRGGRPGQARPAAPVGPRVNLAALRDGLTEVIEPVTRRAGFDLERVSVSRLGRRHRVRVIVDRDEGVGLDAIAEVSQAVSRALDDADTAGEVMVPGEYVLEVSSPGVDRPLTEPRHWRRNLGRLVRVSGPDGEPLTGRISEVTADGVVLEIDGVSRQLRYSQLGPAEVQVELRPSGAEPGEEEGEGDR